MDLLTELTNDYTEEPIDLMESVSRAIKELKLAKKGGKVSNKAIKDFMKKNPTLTQAATINALASYQQYKTNKRQTISLFAKTPYDKRMVKRMVDAMVSTKQFKIHRKTYKNGGQYYELKQIKSGDY